MRFKYWFNWLDPREDMSIGFTWDCFWRDNYTQIHIDLAFMCFTVAVRWGKALDL